MRSWPRGHIRQPVVLGVAPPPVRIRPHWGRFSIDPWCKEPADMELARHDHFPTTRGYHPNLVALENAQASPPPSLPMGRPTRPPILHAVPAATQLTGLALWSYGIVLASSCALTAVLTVGRPDDPLGDSAVGPEGVVSADRQKGGGPARRLEGQGLLRQPAELGARRLVGPAPGVGSRCHPPGPPLHRAGAGAEPRRSRGGDPGGLEALTARVPHPGSRSGGPGGKHSAIGWPHAGRVW